MLQLHINSNANIISSIEPTNTVHIISNTSQLVPIFISFIEIMGSLFSFLNIKKKSVGIIVVRDTRASHIFRFYSNFTR